MAELIYFSAVAFFIGIAIYYGAILAGWYKDTMMAHFRIYGEERRTYPLPRFLRALGAATFLGALPFPLYFNFSLVVLAMMLLALAWIISKSEYLRSYFPLWYSRLLKETDREERRLIAYAWLRLPFKTRLRLNGDSYAFRIFIDELRLTLIYGARAPDDPWRFWN